MEAFKDHVKQHEKGKIKKENSIEGDDDEDEVFEREEIEINGKKILRKKIGKKGKKPPVACEICGTISKGAFNNARHLYTMHGIKREVQCDKCDTLCESVRAMLEHKKNHHSSASCHLCGKVFVEKGHLENHLMRHGIGKDGKNHQNERDFMCEICSKTFTRKNYLVIHMKNHAEKSIKCTVCSKMFRWNSALQAHLTAAHGMGPKEGACTCEFCGRQFQDKSNYRQHRYTHLQVKPFNCEACGKGFIRRDLMKSHKEKCHAATTFNMG
jgi:KRAB domain-containing zinc finger protein